MRNFILTLFLSTGLGLAAKPIKFDFKDPKNVNNVIFQMDAPLESINGSGDGISGTVHFDPNDPSSTQGTILLDSASLRGQPGPQGAYPWFRLDEREKISDHQLQTIQARKHTKKESAFSPTPKEMTIQRHHRNDRSNQITYLVVSSRVAGDLLVIRRNSSSNETILGSEQVKN